MNHDSSTKNILNGKTGLDAGNIFEQYKNTAVSASVGRSKSSTEWVPSQISDNQVVSVTSVNLHPTKEISHHKNGTRLWNKSLFQYFKHTHKLLNFIVPKTCKKMALINGNIWLISSDDVLIYNMQGEYVGAKHMQLVDVIESLNIQKRDVFVITKENKYNGLYILDRKSMPGRVLARTSHNQSQPASQKSMPGRVLARSGESDIFMSLCAYGEYVFMLKHNTKFNTYRVMMYALQAQTADWVKKRQFQFGAALGKVNDIFIVRGINRRDDDDDDLGFFFSSLDWIFMLGVNGGVVYKGANPIPANIDIHINVLGLDWDNNVWLVKPSGHYISNAKRKKWKQALNMIDALWKHDILMDNESGGIWFLEGISRIFGKDKSRVIKFGMEN